MTPWEVVYDELEGQGVPGSERLATVIVEALTARWTLAVERNHRGYGRVTIHRKGYSVHRVAWIERHGPIPSETPLVLHRCDNPPCFKDEHLYLGDQSTNIKDCVNRNRHPLASRQECRRGHPYNATNTYITPSGWRRCRKCHAIRENRRYHEKRRS